MNAKIKLLFTIALFSLVLNACKDKEVVVDTCSNHFLDPGEEKVDCGGNCPACPVEYYPSLYCNVNGIQTSFPTKSLQRSGTDWILSCSNDTCQFYFNLGSNGAVGTYNMEQQGSYVLFHSIPYQNMYIGFHTITSHDVGARRMSGFFQGKFWRPGFVDTVNITGGQYADLKY